MDQPHRTSLMNSADRLTSKDVAVFAPRRHHRWLSAELGCQPSATGLFRLLPLVSGTICTSRLQNLCLSSAVASRLISLGAAFRDTLTVVAPEKWLCHSGHVNRFCYLLTVFVPIPQESELPIADAHLCYLCVPIHVCVWTTAGMEVQVQWWKNTMSSRSGSCEHSQVLLLLES